MNTITRCQINYAKRLIAKRWDGSVINAHALLAAAATLAQWRDRLTDVADRRPGTRVYDACQAEIKDINNVLDTLDTSPLVSKIDGRKDDRNDL